MQISSEQLNILKRFHCVRLDSHNERLLCSLEPQPSNRKILECFLKRTELEANEKGVIASYIVVYKENDEQDAIVCLFFSLRCGELFTQKKYSPLQIQEANKLAPHVMEWLKYWDTMQDEEQNSILKKLQTVFYKTGLEWDDLVIIPNKKRDQLLEQEKEINRVSTIFPGVELKLFGVNERARKFWDKFKLGHSMGETLFWHCVIPKIREIVSLVGVQYLYLFAADSTADEHLIKYYKNRLHLDCSDQVSTNKPVFDFQCKFLFQSVNELFRLQKLFFESFNIDDNFI